MPECVVCGKSFSPKSPRIVACSTECKRQRTNLLNREKYAADLEHQGKTRTHGSAHFGQLRCDVEGCDRKYYAKGKCNMHYARVWRKVNPGSSISASRRYRRRAKDPAHIDREGAM